MQNFTFCAVVKKVVRFSVMFTGNDFGNATVESCWKEHITAHIESVSNLDKTHPKKQQMF